MMKYAGTVSITFRHAVAATHWQRLSVFPPSNSIVTCSRHAFTFPSFFVRQPAPHPCLLTCGGKGGPQSNLFSLCSDRITIVSQSTALEEYLKSFPAVLYNYTPLHTIGNLTVSKKQNKMLV
jgi:hypothetical protein